MAFRRFSNLPQGRPRRPHRNPPEPETFYPSVTSEKQIWTKNALISLIPRLFGGSPGSAPSHVLVCCHRRNRPRRNRAAPPGVAILCEHRRSTARCTMTGSNTNVPRERGGTLNRGSTQHEPAGSMIASPGRKPQPPRNPRAPWINHRLSMPPAPSSWPPKPLPTPPAPPINNALRAPATLKTLGTKCRICGKSRR